MAPRKERKVSLWNGCVKGSSAIPTQIPPARGEVREDATHRLAFECLRECFAASQGASSLRIRAGSLPREAGPPARVGLAAGAALIAASPGPGGGEADISWRFRCLACPAWSVRTTEYSTLLGYILVASCTLNTLHRDVAAVD
jgi:hypothetical protein